MEDIKNFPGPDPMVAVVMSETAEKKGAKANWELQGVRTIGTNFGTNFHKAQDRHDRWKIQKGVRSIGRIRR